MYLLFYVLEWMFFVDCLTNTISDPDILSFSQCLNGGPSDSSVNCVVSQNYSAPLEENDVTLALAITYTISSPTLSTEIFSLTLNVKRIIISGECTFEKLEV
jgi:hypothetical protein